LLTERRERPKNVFISSLER